MNDNALVRVFMPLKRGIICPPNSGIFFDPSYFKLEGGPGADDWRYFLLYWDRVLIPEVQIEGILLGGLSEEILATRRVETSPPIRVQNAMPFNPMEVASRALFERRKNDKETEWTLHQLGSQFDWHGVTRTQKEALKIQLLECLPVPSGEVYINDVLEFKARYQDEFDAFHRAIDELYFDILKSPDPDLAKKRVVADLKDTIAILDRITKEKFKVLSRRNLVVNFVLEVADNLARLKTISEIFRLDLSLGVVASVAFGGAVIKAKYEPSLALGKL